MEKFCYIFVNHLMKFLINYKPVILTLFSNLQIQGQIHHRIGSLLPLEDARHKFLQIYFMGNMEEQLDRRQEINTAVKRATLHDLQHLLHEHHALVRLFMTALERMPNDDYKVVIRADKRPTGTHERTFNAPTIDEVAILIVGENLERRDIALARRDTGQIQQICETHRSYDTLQYPLMFWQGEDGYHFNIKMINPLNSEYQYQFIFQHDIIFTPFVFF